MAARKVAPADARVSSVVGTSLGRLVPVTSPELTLPMVLVTHSPETWEGISLS